MKLRHTWGWVVGMLLASCTPAPTYDLILKGAEVLDGTGAPAIRADVGILNGKIEAIGDLTGSAAIETIDVSGLIISPGFIDVHAHIESLPEVPASESKLVQGVTTCLGGQDGNGPFPLAKYLDSITALKPAMNVGYFTGHNTIRYAVMKNDNRAPTDIELDSMKKLVDREMKAGAFGLSTGLLYLPGTYSKTDEVIALSAIASANGGLYTSHLRNEGLGLMDGVNEALVIGRDAHIPVVLTHHKAMGKQMWGSSVRTLAKVDSARKTGLSVYMDQYPYTASSTALSVLFPRWSLAGTNEDLRKRVTTPSLRDSILAGIRFNLLNDRGGGDLRRIQFSEVAWDTTLEGHTLLDYLNREKIKPTMEEAARVVVDMQLKGGASCIFHAISEEDVERIMQHSFTMHASDGDLLKPGENHNHPRALGTFPRILGVYVREKKLLPLPEAIRKMTSLPAMVMGLSDRGLVQKGKVADLTVFNASTVIDKATFEKPYQRPEGIIHVVVSGKVAVRNGIPTGERAGVVLRGPSGR